MKDIQFSKTSIIVSFSFVVLITVSSLNFSDPTISEDGGKYFIIFSAFFGILVQLFKTKKPQ